MQERIPEFLVEKIKEQYSKEEAEQIIDGLTQKRKTTFRINRIKTNIQEIEQILNQNEIEFSKVDFFEDAFILKNGNEQVIKEFDIYKDGRIYLQSLSSMLPVIILNPKEKENILDICAAPRWKNISNFKSYRKQSFYYCM